MKWLYPPFIFTLAFFYAKINYNDFMPKKNQWPVSRAPAQKAQTCKEMLSDFYPSQTSNFLDDRLDNNQDFFSFFRAFSPLFYNEINNQKLNTYLSPLNKFRGTIAGDLHIENFGFIINDKGVVVFAVNDIDDATEGFFSYDVIRHFVSAKIVDKKITWDEYFSAYQKGLKGESHAISFHVNLGMESVADVTKENLEKYIKFEVPFKFKKFKKPHRTITDTESAALEKGLREKFPDIEIFDQYVRIKDDGGSAGLIRYQVLARVSPKDKVQWLDIKETAVSGYDRVFDPKTTVAFEDRLTNVKTNIYNNQFDESLKVIRIDKHAYSLRFVDQFSSSLKLADIPEDDYRSVILDEAYVIGKMHRISLKDDAAEYAKTWSQFKTHELEEKLVNVKYKLKDLYEESKP